MFSAVRIPLVALGLATVATAADLAPRQTTGAVTTVDEPEVTAVTSCHLHESEMFVLLMQQKSIPFENGVLTLGI
jgi:hypothetical protein